MASGCVPGLEVEEGGMDPDEEAVKVYLIADLPLSWYTVVSRSQTLYLPLPGERVSLVD